MIFNKIGIWNGELIWKIEILYIYWLVIFYVGVVLCCFCYK